MAFTFRDFETIFGLHILWNSFLQLFFSSSILRDLMKQEKDFNEVLFIQQYEKKEEEEVAEVYQNVEVKQYSIKQFNNKLLSIHL